MLVPILSLLTLLVSLTLWAHLRRATVRSCPRCGVDLERDHADARLVRASLLPPTAHCGRCGWSGPMRGRSLARPVRLRSTSRRRS